MAKQLLGMLAAVLLSAGGQVRADVLTATGTFQSGATLGGTVTVSGSTVTAVDLTVSSPDNLVISEVASCTGPPVTFNGPPTCNDNPLYTYYPSSSGGGEGFIGASAYQGTYNNRRLTNLISLSIPITQDQAANGYNGGPIGTYSPPTSYDISYASYFDQAGLQSGIATIDQLVSGSLESACATALGPSAVYNLLPGGQLSKDGLPSAMTGVFIPGGDLSLLQAATACGFSTFNWQQGIISLSPEELPAVKETNPSYPKDFDKSIPLPIPTASAPVLDPPPNGWANEGCGGANPFYYSNGLSISSQVDPTIDCTRYDLVRHEYTFSELPNLASKNLCDQVSSPGSIPDTQGLPSSRSPDATRLTFCDTPINFAKPGDFKSFETYLVGVLNGVAVPVEPPVYWTSTIFKAMTIPESPGGAELGLFQSGFNIDVSQAVGGVNIISAPVTGIAEPDTISLVITAVLLLFYLKSGRPKIT